MTGLWQVSGRSDLSWEESLRLDLRYVDNWSPIGDLHILFRTFRAVTGRLPRHGFATLGWRMCARPCSKA